ncbi:hypothetical protein H9L21_06350 [Aeromicrobium senzhongii]|uniref:NERD domain-containing protein n=1 Tax=Aeromicrobium senzhongii TaxID=2663859 RepID=A0ABX6SXQ2_9ACTN|nr:hypothetical protein [Aeromicrobium senzhongii]MTB87413.1 hypothetical protein [Aeromicrobium senzhongii]QNL95530.1 hypothetical protein H9L21_06350 [Aeromicrobium senzhongii]
MSRRNVRSVDPLSRPRLRVVRGEAPEPTEAPPERSDATDVLAGTLIDAFGDRVLFLFHRRLAGQTGDLPIIAVTAAGVHLVEPRSYPGKKVRASRDGSTFVIGGVRHTRIAEQMQQHAEALQATVSTGPIADATVHTSYCFVDGDLPLRPLEVAGVRVLSVRSTLRRLRAGGSLDERQVEALHRDLSRRLVRS